MSNSSETPAAVERLNLASAQRTERLAFETRSEVIDIAYDAIALYLEDDRAAFEDVKSRGFPKGETLGFYVDEDMLATPHVPDTHVRAFGILLVESAIQDGEGTDEDDPAQADIEEEPLSNRLRVYVPVDEGTFIENLQMPARQTVTQAYLEYSLVDAPPVRVAVTPAGIFEYEAAGDEVEEDDVASLRYADLAQQAGNRVDEGIVTAVQALRNIINMHAVPQRYVDIGTSRVTDV